MIDLLAGLEVETLLEGLQDEELRKNPHFLAKVRSFLKDNKVLTNDELDGVKAIKKDREDIPNIEDLLQ